MNIVNDLPRLPIKRKAIDIKSLKRKTEKFHSFIDSKEKAIEEKRKEEALKYILRKA